MTEPLTALLKGETLYSPADKIYVSLYKKSRDGSNGHVGQLMIAHDGYREYNGGDFGPDLIFEPANTVLLIAILAEGAWEVLE